MTSSAILIATFHDTGPFQTTQPLPVGVESRAVEIPLPMMTGSWMFYGLGVYRDSVWYERNICD
jgi:hypothetical protein